MSKIFHIVQSTMTGKRGKADYLELRSEIFENYTISSMRNQTEQNFLHLVTFRPQEEGNPMVQDLENRLKAKNYNFIFTFFGQPFWYAHAGNGDIKKRVEKTFSLLKERFYHSEDYVYFTVIDSDDLYHKDAIREIQSYPFAFKRALYFKQGYLVNILTGQLATYTGSLRCPPFWTIVYPAEIFFDVQKYLDYGLIKVHHSIPLFFDAVQMSDYKYMRTVYGKNISTRWNDPAQQGEITDLKERKEILKDFNIKI